MAHFFGADPVAFYDTAINTDIPDDAVEITADEHAALLVAQARGKRIAAGKDGRPILLDPPAPTRDELESFERIWRDARLRETDSLVARHRDEIETGKHRLSTPRNTAPCRPTGAHSGTGRKLESFRSQNTGQQRRNG